jgi:hypothetical protein
VGQIWSQIEKLIFLGIGNCSWAGFQWRFSSRDVDLLSNPNAKHCAILLLD